MTRRLAGILVLLMAAAGCNENAAQGRVAEVHRLSAQLSAQFSAAAGAANRAVMADSDDVAAAFAREARTATEAVQSTVVMLAPILDGLGYSPEAGLLKEFEGQFAEYRSLNTNILTLVYEGTNVKAQRLSFGVAQEAADALRDALARLAAAKPAADSWRVKALASEALAAAREVQVLQAPHIAEPDDATMTQLESRMTAAETTARRALENLGPLVSAATRPQIAAATAALDRLSSLNSGHW